LTRRLRTEGTDVRDRDRRSAAHVRLTATGIATAIASSGKPDEAFDLRFDLFIDGMAARASNG
jgi:hypothetical protein